MATSGTYTFSLDVMELMEVAYERCAIDFRTGYEAKTARRAMNLLLTDWTNEGVNLWKVSQKTKALTASTATYALDTEVIDVIDGVLRDSDGNDRVLTRISQQDYLDYPDKDQSGPPVVFTANRTSSTVSVTFWPVPDESMTFVYYALILPEDVSGFEQTVDVPRRFMSAFTWGLAWYLANSHPEKVDAERRAELKFTYDELFEKAKTEDRERTSFWVRPKVRR